ncbi:hypothetical protein P5E59_14820 [Clostridium perfringens]|nr:hypothetical protein [Clostridium perfringens]
MKKNDLKTELLYIEIPFCEWIDGEFELLDELYLNYVSNPANIEKIKRFIITDYLTQLDSNELAKMFIDFKSRKTIEQEEERRKQKEIEEAYESKIPDDDMPF